MSLTRQVFRAGIEYSPRDGAWHISTGETPHDSASFEAARGAVPIVVEERGPKYRLTTLVLRSGRSFDVEVSRLLGEAADYRGGFRDWKDVTYLLGALGYHCMNLAETYARVRTMFVTSPARALDDPGRVGFGNWPEVFYELDAVLGVARRTLDISRFVLWRLFGSRGSCPGNFKKTLDACAAIPADLKDFLERTWNEHGEGVTSYRDCIMHYTSLDTSFGTVNMDRSVHGVWMAAVHLPDNPESRSQQQFTCPQGIDALDYAYMVVNVIFEAMRALADCYAVVATKAADEAPEPSLM